MASFGSFKEKALDLAQAGAAKARGVTDVARLNLAIATEEDRIRKAYMEMGKLYFAEHGSAPEGAYVAQCEKVNASMDIIREHRTKLADMKDSGVSVDDDVEVEIEVPYEEVVETEPTAE